MTAQGACAVPALRRPPPHQFIKHPAQALEVARLTQIVLESDRIVPFPAARPPRLSQAARVEEVRRTTLVQS